MPESVSTKLQRIAERAKREKEAVFTRISAFIDEELLNVAYRLTRKDAAPGVDGQTGKEYAKCLEQNIKGLSERIRQGNYKAPPVLRGWIPKADGESRPIGQPVFEDKIAQRSVVMLLEAIYEQDFYDFSYGFRRGRSAHDAVRALREQCINNNVQWIIEVDIKDFFGSMRHDVLRSFIERRIKDGGILRLIGKWLNAGVLEGTELTYPENGTPQGGVISPLLANVYLHNVLDEWFVQVVQPRLRGKAFLVRYADDLVIGCELRDDAERLMDVLPKRLAKYGLTIHPEKTRLVAFGKPRDGKRNGTFDFLGFTFYWGRAREGYWVIKKQTAKTRLRRAMMSIYAWCKENMHIPFREQYRALCQKLTGHYQYYGVRSNYKFLELFFEHTERSWKRCLGRRSQKSRINWEAFERLRKLFPLPVPRITHATI